MARLAQSREDLERHLRAQLAFIRSSSAAYDVGFRDEARRLAVCLRVLLHDTEHAAALLTQLRMKASVRFLTSAPKINRRNLLPWAALTSIQVSGTGSEYIPRLNDLPHGERWRSFHEWWTECVVDDKDGGVFSRKKLVTVVANQDGGAHVDPNLDGAYARLSRENSMGFYVRRGEIEENPQGVALASVRQIAHEFVLSAQKYAPSYL